MCSDLQTFIAGMPKIELHRHLSGAATSAQLFEIASNHGLKVEGGTFEAFRKLTSMHDSAKGFHAFLENFKPRSRFYVKRALITEVTRSVIKEAAAENIIHLELRFSPSHFARHMHFDLEEVAAQIITAAEEQAAAEGMGISFLMTLTRDLGLEENRTMVRIATESRLSRSFTGIDIAGDEANIRLATLAELIDLALAGGKKLTIHAGEAGPAANVSEAIEAGAVRIGHGVRSFTDPAVLQLARERGITYEVCPTSNLQTSTIQNIGELRLPALLREGIRITINTDDPGISETTLTGELLKVTEEFSLSADQLMQLMNNAAEALFVSPERRAKLKSAFEAYHRSSGA